MKFFLSFAIAVTIGLSAQSAMACTCLEPTLSDRHQNADVIFSGTVDEVVRIPKYHKSNMADTPIEVTFTVQDVFKGEDRKAITLHTSFKKYNCAGFAFEVGQPYLVFAYLRRQETFEHWSLYNYPSGTYGVGGGCGGTKPLNSAKAQGEISILKD